MLPRQASEVPYMQHISSETAPQTVVAVSAAHPSVTADRQPKHPESCVQAVSSGVHTVLSPPELVIGTSMKARSALPSGHTPSMMQSFPSTRHSARRVLCGFHGSENLVLGRID